jgi:hypothetical protein
MKKIIFFIFVFWLLGMINFVFGEDCVCCVELRPSCGRSGCTKPYYWQNKENCGLSVDNTFCKDSAPPSTCQIPQQQTSQQQPSGTTGQQQFKTGNVTVTWTPILISVCPPGIFGGEPCSYPDLIDLIKRINQLLLTISPPLLVILIILGGFMYLLSPFNVEEQIKKGHRFIWYAILGYILLLLVTLIFTIISAILGGPSPSK